MFDGVFISIYFISCQMNNSHFAYYYTYSILTDDNIGYITDIISFEGIIEDARSAFILKTV